MEPFINGFVGFTFILDDVTSEVGLISAAVYGAIYRHLNIDNHLSQPSLETIARELGINRATVMRHLHSLCEKGFLKDVTPYRRNRPHLYCDVAQKYLSETDTAILRMWLDKHDKKKKREFIP